MQSTLELQLHPVDLREFGKTAKGQPRYRIVWSDTRIDKMLVRGKIVTLPRYADYPGKWILEKHLPVELYVGLTREEWSAMFAGPMFGAPAMEYPADGDYELSYVFEGHVSPEDAKFIPRVIEWDQANFTDADRERAIALKAELDQENLEQKWTDELKAIMESRPTEDN